MRLFIRFELVLILLLSLVGNTLFAQVPTVVTGNVSGGAACAGTVVPVSFVTANFATAKRLFTVQLSNSTGVFTSPTVLATGTASPIQVTLPATVLGGDYKLRVITDTTGITYTPSATFTMLKLPTAALSGDTSINFGGTAQLSIAFTGNGPWTYTFTNTSTGTTSINPLKGIVQPTFSTTYALQSVSNICGAGTVSGSARVTVYPRITTDFTATSLCAGAAITVPFTVAGTFAASGVTYTAQLFPAGGTLLMPITLGSGTVSPLNVTLPANLTAGSYQIRVIASSVATYVSSAAFSIKPLPTAILSGNAAVGIGDTTSLNIAFTGDAPWTYQLASGPVITTSVTPIKVVVSPTVSTNYSLVSVSNACGTGAVSGTAAVTVVPRISAADVTVGSVCVGANISLPFTVTGEFSTPATYTVQLSDAAGSFATPRILATGASSPISISIPTNLGAGTGYRLRVVANSAASSLNSPAFTVKARPTAVLSGNSVVNFGEKALLALNFTGEGPWTFTLSDGSTGTATQTPFVVSITPTQTSTYVVSSVRNVCGEGSTSGSALVTVIPRLLTENPGTAICSGKDIEIKFTVGGVLSGATSFQAQLSDSTGAFTNPVLIGTGTQSPIIASIPATTPVGGSYRIRVVATGGSAITLVPTNPFFLGRRPGAVLSGGGTFPLKPGEEVFLVIQFSGDGPWTYTLSDNTTGTSSITPALLTVVPQFTTTYTLKSVSNTCGEGNVSGSALANVIITSIEDPLKSGISFFPNPVAKQLTINITNAAATEWQLMDLQGRTLKSSRWEPRLKYEDTVDIQSFPAGTYFVKVKINDRWFSTKMVKE
ncbi:T9SS type A sorting domain-containing protein [Runella sp.]|uniref:T9SS type A sorting domain-containing protein n=1 Tax=Runella sp. TaxID=1960881 RepID=UPI003D123BD8